MAARQFGFRKKEVDVAMGPDVKKMVDSGLQVDESSVDAVLISEQVPIVCISRIDMLACFATVDRIQEVL